MKSFYCGKCGKKIPYGAVYCPYCGSKDSENKNSIDKTGEKEKENEDARNTTNGLFMVVLIVSIIALAVSTLVFMNLKTRNSTMNNYDAYISDNTTEESEMNADPIDYYAEINQVGNSYNSIDDIYSLKVAGDIDEFRIMQSSSNQYKFTFYGSFFDRRSSDKTKDASDNICIGMSGQAKDLLGLINNIEVSTFESISGVTLSEEIEQAPYESLYEGLSGTLNMPGEEKPYTIIIKGATTGGTITPETEIYIYEKQDEKLKLFDESIWTCIRGQTVGAQSLILFHQDGSFSEYFYGPEEIVEAAGTWDFDSITNTLYLTDTAFYMDGHEEAFIQDGEAFRSEEPVEMMSGFEYQWIRPGTDNVGAFN